MGYLRTLLLAAAAATALFATPAQAASDGADDTPPPPAAPPAVGYEQLTPASNVLDPSGVTAADIDRFLAPTPLHGYGGEFMAAEARTGVNARFLVGITWIENNSGRSQLAQQQHNLFSILGADGWASYASFDDSIRQSSDYIGAAYAHPGGAHYRGGTIAAIGRVYAADPEWGVKVANAANLITPGAEPDYAAQLSVAAVTGGQLGLHVTDTGRAAWDAIPNAALMVHFRWSKPGADSLSGLLSTPLPGLRNTAAADLALAGFPVPDGAGWTLAVTAELDGDGWATELGSGAADRQRFDFDGGPDAPAARGAAL